MINSRELFDQKTRKIENWGYLELLDHHSSYTAGSKFLVFLRSLLLLRLICICVIAMIVFVPIDDAVNKNIHLFYHCLSFFVVELTVAEWLSHHGTNRLKV